MHKKNRSFILKILFFSFICLTILLELSTQANAGILSEPQLGRSLEPSLQCSFIHIIEQNYLSQHIKYSALDDSLKQKVIDQYIKHLDPTKVYLLKSDVEDIKKMLASIFEKIKARDCEVLFTVQSLLNKRVEERAEFAKKILDKNYKFDKTVEFIFDPDKKAYPTTKQESEEFFKKYVHFQISNYLATDMKLEEAKTNVIKGWDRSLKRLKEVKEDDVYAGYLDVFARSLDPHSSFMSKEIFEDFDIQMSLSLEGIGATLSFQDGFTVVEALVPGGSAARSGLVELQDKIVAVGQGKSGPTENVVEMDLRDVVKKIRGPKGTKVRLTLLRKKADVTKRVEITLERDKVKLEDDAASIIYSDREINGQKKKLGVLILPSFYASSKKGGSSSAIDMKKILVEAREKKIDGLVLDLSTNGGGSLDDAVKIAGLFFASGNVVKQSSKDEKGEVTLKDKDNNVDWPGPLVVLTSRLSASASEIVAGTLRDYKRAVIVGSDHTFGKGSVQSVMGIPQNLGALKVTIGMFFIPGGNSTQHRGVESDVIIPSPYNNEEYGEKNLDYSLPPKAIPSFVSKEAAVIEGANAWIPLREEFFKTLAEKSKVRVDKNEAFKKILDELKVAKEKGKVIKLSEATKEKEKKDKMKAQKNATKDEKQKEALKRPEIQEAINVLSDLIQLESTKTTDQTPKEPETKKK